ncbi:MAG: peptide chain release factor N(5)-glutamine methyltransferase [Brevinema sp.]
MNYDDMIQESNFFLPLDQFPERDEEIIRIIEEVFGIKKHDLFLNKGKTVSEDLITRFFELIKMRSTGKPLAQILGYSYFYQHKFPVSEQTLIPRYDTEHLVDAVKKNIENKKKILDLCTGTGIIALSLHAIFPDKKIKGIDIVDQPFIQSQDFLGFHSNNLSFQKMDFLQKEQWESLGSWDCIVSNPPYLDDHDMKVLTNSVKEFEPHSALYGGQDGMLFYRHIAEFAEHQLNNGGLIVLEIDHKHQAVSNLFSQDIYPIRELISDYNNLPRILVLKKE